jgi:light-independent protochlorophyllide reductase subunit B
MGLEEHLLQMFRDDFEFNDGAKPSHLPAVARPAGAGAVAEASAVQPAVQPAAPAVQTDAESEDRTAQDVAVAVAEAEPVWTGAGELELKKIPFFVRGKARRNTERFARERGLAQITVETLYEAKAHFGR